MSVFRVLSKFVYFFWFLIRFSYDSIFKCCSRHSLSLCSILFDLGSWVFSLFFVFGSIVEIVASILVWNCFCWILFIWVGSLVAFDFLHNKFFVSHIPLSTNSSQLATNIILSENLVVSSNEHHQNDCCYHFGFNSEILFYLKSSLKCLRILCVLCSRSTNQMKNKTMENKIKEKRFSKLQKKKNANCFVGFFYFIFKYGSISNLSK